MKKIIIGAIAAFTAVLVGCDKDQTVEEMTKLGTASGYTAAYVLTNQVKVDGATRNAIIGVITEVEKYVPETNETYAAVWTPIAKKYLDDLKDKDGYPLPESTKERVLKDFDYIVGLLDKYIEKKEITGKKDLVDAFIHSFCGSFLANFKPVSNTFGTAFASAELDEFAKSYLESVIK